MAWLFGKKQKKAEKSTSYVPVPGSRPESKSLSTVDLFFVEYEADSERAEQYFQAGSDAYQGNRYEDAKEHFEESALAGSETAAFCMAYIYMSVDKDFEEARQWAEIARRLGSPDAEQLFADIRELERATFHEEGVRAFQEAQLADERGDYPANYELYVKAAEHDIPEGAFMAAICLLKYEKDLASYPKAIRWAKKARERGVEGADELIQELVPAIQEEIKHLKKQHDPRMKRMIELLSDTLREI